VKKRERRDREESMATQGVQVNGAAATRGNRSEGTSGERRTFLSCSRRRRCRCRCRISRREALTWTGKSALAFTSFVGLPLSAVFLADTTTNAVALASEETSKKAERIARDYDKYSEKYDKLEVGELAKAWQLSDLRQTAVSKAAGRTLEIGIGTGINLELYDFDRVTRLTGLDISEGMLDKSKERVSEKNLGERVELVQGDAARLPFESNSFDTVIVTYALCVIPDAESSLREIARVLKSDGSGYLVEHISSDFKPLASYQSLISPFIAQFGKGCDPSKDIPSLAQASGLRLVDIDRRVKGTVALMQVSTS